MGDRLWGQGWDWVLWKPGAYIRWVTELVPWCVLPCHHPSTEGISPEESGQRSGTVPGVTFQEPTNLLREGDSLHLARREGGLSRRRDKGRRPAPMVAGRGKWASSTRGTCTSATASGAPSSRAGPPAARSGSGARSGLRARGPWAQVHARAPALTEVAHKVKGVALCAPHQKNA